MKSRIPALTALLALVLVSGLEAQKTPPKAPQKNDEEYTRLIKQNLQDPRITTELVDHLPASDTVPSPLKFLGRAVGAPGELTYAKDIYRYYEALAKAAPTRAKYFKIGKTEEGRDIVLLAVGRRGRRSRTSTSTSDMLGELTDPRKTTEAQRAAAASTPAKPIYYAIERHPLAGDRRPRDADGAGLPPDRRGDAVHPEHPQQRDHAHHAGHRGRRPREAGRQRTTSTRSARRATRGCR